MARRTFCTIDGCERAEQARGMCGPHYGAWHRKAHPHTKVCNVCGVTFTADRPTAKVCSKSCRAHLANVSQRANWAAKRLPVLYVGPEHIPPAVNPPASPTRSTFVSAQCKHCTRWYISGRQTVGFTCSTECGKAYSATARRLGKDRRRARQKAAFVSNVNRKQVHERDGFRCHICKRKTDATKAVPHPKAPTIDHVIPLARGGKHEPANCRTACFLCNSIKSDGGGGEQLLLLA